MASGLENTGRYAWPIDSRTPPKFYLRLEVRDEAGKDTLGGGDAIRVFQDKRPADGTNTVD